MFTVALIGGDGAGKTTVANAVIASSDLPMKYLYMGLSTRSSNFALPTSRLVLLFKRHQYKRAVKKAETQSPDTMPASQLEYTEQTQSQLWNAARFLNRMAEAWFRQLISISYQLQGYVVIYDRHFYFDAAPVAIDSQNNRIPFSDRLYFWLMSHWYPKPTLTILLDAPTELLYERKAEASVEYLSQQRSVYLEQGKRLANFIRVDAAQPLDKVVDEVKKHISDYYEIHAH